MSEKVENIIVYPLDDVIAKGVGEIRNFLKLVVFDETYKESLDQLYNLIRSLYPQHGGNTCQISFLDRKGNVCQGSTSLLYFGANDDNKYLYKIFAPLGTQRVEKNHISIYEVGSMSPENYFKRLDRFLNQNELFEKLCGDLEGHDKNFFNHFTMGDLVLTSEGFAYRMENYRVDSIRSIYEEITEETKQKETSRSEYIRGLICLLEKLIKGVAENVKVLHDKGYYHGDVKPENFIRLYSGMDKNEFIIRAIDYDTLKTFSEIQKTKNIGATTRAYYDEILKGEEISVEKLKKRDIMAICKLMVAILSGMKFEDFSISFQDEFYKKLSKGIGTNDYRGLYLYEQVANFVSDGLDGSIGDLDDFLSRLHTVVVILKYANSITQDNNYKDFFIQEMIDCANAKLFDEWGKENLENEQDCVIKDSLTQRINADFYIEKEADEKKELDETSMDALFDAII